MKRINQIFRSFAGREKKTGAPSVDLEIQGLLDDLEHSPDLLLRELEEGNDCPDDEAFSRFLSGRCGQEEKRRIHEHITSCYPCLATVDDLTREARVNTGRETRKAMPSARPGSPSRRGWAWGMGLGTPALALCVLLVVLFPGPALKMDLEVTRSAVRSEGRLSVEDGGLLHPGDRFRMEISARRDGFFYLYAWNQGQGGQFIFPSPEFPDENRIGKGQTLFVPDMQGWQLEEAVPGSETLFLLFSPLSVDREALSRVEQELEGTEKGLSYIEGRLKESFSLEQRITYRVE